MTLFALSGLLTGLTSLPLGVFVYLKDRKSWLNKIWGVFACAVAVWGFGAFLIGTTRDPGQALLWWRLTHIGVIAIPVLFLHFVYQFLELKRRKTILFMYGIGLAFLSANFTDLFIYKVRFVFSSFYYDSPPGPLYPYFVGFFFGAIIYSHYELLRAFKHSSGPRRNQIKYFFLATAVGFAGGGTAFLPVFGVDVYPILNFSVPLYPIIMTYAIVKYRLMDITVVMHKGLTYALLALLALVPAYLAIMIGQRATFYSLPPLAAGMLVLASGVWVLLKNPKAVTNRTFSLLCLAGYVWLFSFFMIYSSVDRAEAIFWGKFLHIGIVYVPALFYHFTVTFLELPTRPIRILLPYLVSTAFLLSIPTRFLVDGQHTYYWGYYPKGGLLHPVLVGYFGALGAVCLLRLYRGYKAKALTDPQEANRIRLVFWAFLFGFGAALDFAQNYGVEVYPPGFALVSLWVILVSYAVAKYQLLNIPVIINKAKLLPYAQGLAIVVSIYAGTLLLIRWFTGSMYYLLAAILLATCLICAELLVTVQRRMERAVGRALFRERHDAYETLAAFSKDMVSILDLRNLSNRFLGVLSDVLNIPMVSLFLLDKEKQQYTLACATGIDPNSLDPAKLPSQHPLARQLVSGKVPIVREELERANSRKGKDKLVETLRGLRSEACLPLVNKERLVGFCNLGPRANRQMYSEEDLSLLTTLAQNAAIALDNALLYEDVKKSQVLMRRTDRLRSLETIAGGFAHEIRNPLTSIKTFIQLAPERKDDADFIVGFSRVVNDDVYRIERLIEEILDYARYMKPKLTLEDLNEIVASCLYFVQVKADSLGIIIEKDLVTGLPAVMLDRQQIKQVLLNLFLNALDAMKDGGGQMTIRTHRLVKQQRQEWVQVEVIDTGQGIDPANLEHIFDPFYTTKHESQEREGTGLGLAIVHQIVQEHHGSIEVESAVGRGTTFFVNLPATGGKVETLAEREEHEKTGPVGR